MSRPSEVIISELTRIRTALEVLENKILRQTGIQCTVR